MLQDLRYALRAMIRNKVFTALAVLSLALGIGANTAILSFLDFFTAVTLRVNFSAPMQHSSRVLKENF